MFRLPLLIPAFGWVTGLAAARTDWLPWPVLAWLAGVSALFLFVSKTRKYAVILLAGIVWGTINLVWDARLVAFDNDWLEGAHQITASVMKTQHTQTYTRLTLRRISGSSKKGDSLLSSGRKSETVPFLLRGQAWLYVYQHAARKIRPGDHVQARVRWHAPRNHNNPGGFDFEAYCFDRHIALIGSAKGPVAVLASDASWLEGMRQRIRDAVNALPDTQAGIIEALLLADRSHIPIRIQDAFAATGAMHLLAISGLHVGMAGAIGFGLCWWLLTRREAWIVGFPVRGISLISGLMAATAYASLAGWPLPTQRAAMMLAAGVVAWWIKARTAPVNTLLAALILILLLDAQAVGSVSLWLSFIATAAILFWAGRRESHVEGFHVRRAFAAMLWVALIASLATLPLIADVFGRLPLYSLPANVVMVPLYSLFILPLALAGAVLICFGMSGVATWLFSVAGHGIDMGNRLLAWMLQWPGSHMWVPSVPWWLTGLYVTGAMLTAMLLWKGRRRVAWVSMTGVVLVYGMVAAQERLPAQTQLIAWDVGQGAAVSLVTPDGRVMVVDAPGKRGSRFNGGSIVAAGLRTIGITHADVLVVTHAQSDHMGGMMRLLDQLNHVDQLWLADVPDVHRHPGIQRLIQRVQAQGGAVRWLKRGENIRFGGVRGTVLWPPAGYHPSNPNNASLILSLQLENGNRLLFPGDIEAEAEHEILTYGLTPYDVMLMPHHGSTTSSTLAFVRAAMPKAVIAQTGYANRYGFPKPQVVQRYEQAGARIWDTSHGAVVVTPDGKNGIHAIYAPPVRSDKRKRALQWWRQTAP
ncbi:MAG: DNA internalization-related competence protein ComEC/Rec2 [Mariprofundaceae bacterium]|nr:DNA internalization-related competence protein ComEC/Rec2 [Mariprofundaceae bacterium]